MLLTPEDISRILGVPMEEGSGYKVHMEDSGYPDDGDLVGLPGIISSPDEPPKGYDYYVNTDSKLAYKKRRSSAGQMGVAMVDLATGLTDRGGTINSFLDFMYRSQLTRYNPSIKDAAIPGTSTQAMKQSQRIGRKGITLAGGAAADQALVPALAGYYGVLRLKALISDTADTYELTFQDEDNTVLLGLSPTDGRYDVVVATPYIPVALEPFVLTQATLTDNKALEVDVAGGAGAEELLLLFDYWYET